MPETIGLDMISKRHNGSFLIRGYNEVEQMVYFELTAGGQYKRITSLYNPENFKNFFYSESKYIEATNGTIYISGDSKYPNLERPVATILSISGENNYSAIYTAKEPFSFITDMILNEEENQLVFVGTLNAEDEYGNCGTPFIRCIDLKEKRIMWEAKLNGEYEICARVTRCEDYGYILLLVNVDEDGAPSVPFKIIRTNATGK